MGAGFGMSKIKRAGLFAFIFVASAYILITLSGRFIRSAIETFGPKVLGVGVSVGEVFLVPLLGKASVRGLKIENLPGYKEKYLFEVGSISVSLDLKSLLKDTIVIHSIVVNAPKISWEGSLSESNVTKLQKQVAGGGDGAKEMRPVKILVEHFAIRDAKAIVRMGKGEPMKLSLPPIVLENVRSDKRAEATSKVVGIVVAELSKQIILEIGKHPEILNSVGDAVGGIVNGVKGLFGK